MAIRMKNAMLSWGFRFFPVTILRNSKKFLVWEQNGNIYQWEKGSKCIENTDTDEIIPVLKISVKN